MSKIEAKYVSHMGTDVTVVNAARVSFGKQSTELDARDEKLISYLANHEHFSPFEHCTATFLIKCPLYIRSQIHRHRTFAYNEISRRYTEENIEFHEIEEYRTQHISSKQCSSEALGLNVNEMIQILVSSFEARAKYTYERLLKYGVAREQARAVLPQSLMTQFYMTGNLRNWAHFLRLRLDKHAQPEVQEVAQQIYDRLINLFPVSLKALFKDMYGNEERESKKDNGSKENNKSVKGADQGVGRADKNVKRNNTAVKKRQASKRSSRKKT